MSAPILRSLRATIVALAMAACLPAAAGAQLTCPPIVYLSPRTPHSLGSFAADVGFLQEQQTWCALGVLPDPAAQWDLQLFSSTAPWPTCYLGELGTAAAYDSIAFLVGDYSGGAGGQGIARAFQQLGGDALAEWDPGSGPLFYEQLGTTTLNRPSFLRVWDFPVINQGLTHYLIFRPFSLTGTLYVFRNPGGAPGFWATPDQALLRLRSKDFPPHSAWGAHLIPFVPPANGRYAVVFVRDNDVDDQMFLGYGYCGAPVLVGSGAPYYIYFGTNRVAFNQNAAAWSAVGVRGSTDDWEISLYRGNGGPYPECMNDLVTKSATPATGVEFIVGDFHRNPQGYFYAFATDWNLLPYGTSGIVEYDGGADELVVNGNAALRGTDGNDVLETWDVYLEAGRTYDFEFTHTPAADLRLFLFGTQAPQFFAHRQGRLLESGGWAVYTAPHTGWYGVVVTNENGGTGTYTLRVSTETVDAASPALPARSQLVGIAPNPSRTHSLVTFDLARPGRAGVEILDLRGRIVATVPPRDRDAGRWSEAWDGAGSDGRRAGAGMYVARLRVDGVVLDERKLIRLAP